ncbi:hypothetical protein M408DRAFT_10956 [Serendipita vermifera MAFF 305830]|uniref:Uncharacterized protein n=1 Tax=Serendipita vermifera MAFF 305830 TaxID=933852 RepID=A0A0C3AX05_SERVB|nr:hypothetical protein M408DRAFT_10956 [Serendipita vermifera MAFF 305830]
MTKSNYIDQRPPKQSFFRRLFCLGPKVPKTVEEKSIIEKKPIPSTTTYTKPALLTSASTTVPTYPAKPVVKPAPPKPATTYNRVGRNPGFTAGVTGYDTGFTSGGGFDSGGGGYTGDGGSGAAGTGCGTAGDGGGGGSTSSGGDGGGGCSSGGDGGGGCSGGGGF